MNKGISRFALLAIFLSFALVAHGLWTSRPRHHHRGNRTPTQSEEAGGPSPRGESSPRGGSTSDEEDSPSPAGSGSSGGSTSSAGGAAPAASGSAASGSTPTAGGSAGTSSPSSGSSSSSPSSSGGGKVYTNGIASYYTEWKTAPGSCGSIPSNGNIAAVNASVRQCGKCININYNGKTLKVQITDTCPSCPENKIDLSDVAFQQLDSLSKGLINIQWSVVDC